MILGKMLEDYMNVHSLSYEKFGAMCGLSKGYISMLVNNNNPKTNKPPVPSIETYNNIAKAMGMSVDELWDSIDDAPVYIGKVKTKAVPIQSTNYEHTTERKPDFEGAALKATETLIRYKISTVPVMPFNILKSIPGVFIVSFTEFADNTGVDNDNLVTLYDSESQDVVTITKEINGKTQHIIAYNQRLPFYIIHRAMARELGHIMLGHDRTQPDDAQTIEALIFMRYLLCPRPMLKMLFEDGIQVSVEKLGNLTGLYGRSIAGIRETPGAHIPSKMNRKIRDQFSAYMRNVIEYTRSTLASTNALPADFGTYMDNYEE